MNIVEQLKTGLAYAQKVKAVPSSSFRIIICGMGGSIMPAEALSMLWLDKPAIYINRTAYLPHWANSQHAVICISWSGNTEETIACFKEALQKNIPVWVITAGGHLAELATKKDIPTVILPSHGLNPVRSLARAESTSPKDLGEATSNGINPRDALGVMFSALLTLISRSDIIENSKNSSSFHPTDSGDLAKNLAAKIGSKTPLLYSSYPWRFIGSFWKIFFNENTKIHSFFNFLPGAGHNEIAGVKKQDPNFFYLLLRDAQDHHDNIKKLDQLARFLDSYGTAYEVVDIAGENRPEKIFEQYLLASATSTALAHQLGVDPHSTETIENFKHLI